MPVVSDNHVRANFVKPDVWDDAIALGSVHLSNSPPLLGTMVVGSTPNLLFFSPTYWRAIHEKIKWALSADKTKTYFLIVDADAFGDTVDELGKVADNLMFNRMKKPIGLFFLEVKRGKGAPLRAEGSRGSALERNP